MRIVRGRSAALGGRLPPRDPPLRRELAARGSSRGRVPCPPHPSSPPPRRACGASPRPSCPDARDCARECCSHSADSVSANSRCSLSPRAGQPPPAAQRPGPTAAAQSLVQGRCARGAGPCCVERGRGGGRDDGRHARFPPLEDVSDALLRVFPRHRRCGRYRGEEAARSAKARDCGEELDNGQTRPFTSRVQRQPAALARRDGAMASQAAAQPAAEALSTPVRLPSPRRRWGSVALTPRPSVLHPAVWRQCGGTRRRRCPL